MDVDGLQVVVRDVATWLAAVAIYLTIVVIYALILTGIIGVAIIVGYEVVIRSSRALRKLRTLFADNTN